MVAFARAYRVNPLIRELSASLIHACPERDDGCEAAALQVFVRDQVRYTRDVLDVETLQTPLNTLGYLEQPDGTYLAADPPQAKGDCDDKATLLAACLLSVGIGGRFCALGVNGMHFDHVLTQARIRGRGTVEYLPLETIVPGVEAGWFPPDASCLMVAHFG